MTRVAHSPKRASAVTKRRTPSRAMGQGLLSSYWAKSQTPLTALLFILPLLIFHEIGVRWYGTIPERVLEYRVAAFALMTRFFHAFGASGQYLPALAVVAVLLSWHIARRDFWVFNIHLLPFMAIESIAWAIPLLGVYFLFSPGVPNYLGTGEWKLMASLYLGAGIYEELIFRLAAFSVLSFLLIDAGRVKPKWATPVIVLIAAIVFSSYHILGSGHIPWQAFVFIALRGIYYGIIFIERGFGLTVGAHTVYDLMFLALSQVSQHY